MTAYCYPDRCPNRRPSHPLRWLAIGASCVLLTVGALIGSASAQTAAAKPVSRPPVEVEETASGTFRYVIRDIRTPRWLGRRLGFGRAIEFFRKVLENETFTVNPRSGEATFTRDKKYGDLEERIERCAKGNGFMPYWEELVARSVFTGDWPAQRVKRVFTGNLQGEVPEFVGFRALPKSGDGSPRRYQLRVRGAGAARGGKKSLQIHEYTLDKSDGHYRLKHTYSQPDFGRAPVRDGRQEMVQLSLGPENPVRFRVNRLAPHCNGGEMYCLRMLTPDNKQLWRNDVEVFGRYRLMAADFDSDGCEELVLFREGHQKGTVVIFEILPTAPSAPSDPKKGTDDPKKGTDDQKRSGDERSA